MSTAGTVLIEPIENIRHCLTCKKPACYPDSCTDNPRIISSRSAYDTERVAQVMAMDLRQDEKAKLLGISNTMWLEWRKRYAKECAK